MGERLNNFARKVGSTIASAKNTAGKAKAGVKKVGRKIVRATYGNARLAKAGYGMGKAGVPASQVQNKVARVGARVGNAVGRGVRYAAANKGKVALAAGAVAGGVAAYKYAKNRRKKNS